MEKKPKFNFNDAVYLYDYINQCIIGNVKISGIHVVNKDSTGDEFEYFYTFFLLDMERLTHSNIQDYKYINERGMPEDLIGGSLEEIEENALEYERLKYENSCKIIKQDIKSFKNNK